MTLAVWNKPHIRSIRHDQVEYYRTSRGFNKGESLYHIHKLKEKQNKQTKMICSDGAEKESEKPTTFHDKKYLKTMNKKELL